MKNSVFGLILFLSLNGMGLGMRANGWDDDRNLAWMFFSTFFHIEAFLLILISVGLIVYEIFSSNISSEAEKHSESVAKTFEPPSQKHFTEEPETFSAPTVVQRKESKAVPVPKKVIQKVFEPTAEELKETAIQQITRGW